MPTAPASVKDLEFAPTTKPFPSPIEWRDQVFYQLLIDRFDDNKRNTPHYDPKTAKRGRDKSHGTQFQGGNLKGVTRRLDYIKNLGCTAIWISPPFKNRQDDRGSYHGYAIQDFLDIDPRFGSSDDLRELVREAHQRGMYVILDIVINHTGDIFRYTQNDTPYRTDGQYDFKEWHRISQGQDLTRDDAIWPVELQTPDAFKRRGSIRNLTQASEDEAVHGDFYSLKELDMNNPIVLDALIQCYKYWIATADVDGFRIDTVRNVEPHFCATFCNAIHEYTKNIGKHNFILFGEIVGDDDLLHKYVGNNGPASGTDEWYPRLDAALDFPLYGILDEIIKGTRGCGDLRARYDHFRTYYRDYAEAARYYVTFIDNHDQSHRPWRRFMHGVNDPRVAVLGIGYLLTGMGIPCIYYGTEQGFDGAGDGDAFIRETMFGGQWGAFDTTGVQFFDDSNPIYKEISKIAKVRADEPALRYGRLYFRNISGDGKNFGCPVDGKCTLAFSRVLDTREVVVAMNLDQADRKDYILVDGVLSPPGTKMEDLLNNQALEVEESESGAAAVQVKLPARTMAILGKA